jgi:hypothetical protein
MILKDWKLLSLRRPIKTMLVTSAIIGASAASAQMMQEYPYSTFKGFQEINHSSTDDTSSGFSLGQFTLHNNAYFSDNVSGFTELTWTVGEAQTANLDTDGTVIDNDEPTKNNGSQSFSPAVERVVVRYDYSDALKISAGKYHTATSFWNGYYHHGRWLQTTIDRPKMLGFGGDFIPIHFTGLMVEGQLGLDGINFNYNLGYGNGRSQSGSTAGEAGDYNNKPAYSATFFVQPEALGGTRIGLGYYSDMLSGNVEEVVTTAHIVYQFEQPEFIAEYAQIDHTPDGGDTHTSRTSYIQVGWRLDAMNGQFKPYYRTETHDIEENDKTLSDDAADNTWQTIGLRWDFTDYACLKFEQQTDDNSDAVTRKIQLASTF